MQQEPQKPIVASRRHATEVHANANIFSPTLAVMLLVLKPSLARIHTTVIRAAATMLASRPQKAKMAASPLPILEQRARKPVRKEKLEKATAMRKKAKSTRDV